LGLRDNKGKGDLIGWIIMTGIGFRKV